MNGAWDEGDRHVFETLFEGDSDWYVIARVYDHYLGVWVWSVTTMGYRYQREAGLAASTVERALYPSPEERLHPSEEEARDACVAWLQRATLVGCLRSR